MTTDSPIKVCVVCEAEADAQTACDLSDRVLVEKVDWVEPDMVEHLRDWLEYEQGIPYVIWRKIDDHIDRLPRVIPHKHGYFDGEPSEPYAKAAWKALALNKAVDSPPEVVFLIVDADNQSERRAGLNQARDTGEWPFQIVTGLAITKRECWVLAGFVPSHESERTRLGEVRSELGFDPTRKSHRLTAAREPQKKTQSESSLY